jgi:hypothetical protein
MLQDIILFHSKYINEISQNESSDAIFRFEPSIFHSLCVWHFLWHVDDVRLSDFCTRKVGGGGN